MESRSGDAGGDPDGGAVIPPALHDPEDPFQARPDAGGPPDVGATVLPGLDASSPGADAAAPGPDAASPCPPLAGRLTVAALELAPTAVSVGSGYGWAANDMVIAQPLSNGRLRVAWSDGAAIHLTPLDAGLARAGADLTVAGQKLRGFVAHEDGRAAVVLVRADAVLLVGFDAAGAKQFETVVVGPGDPTLAGSKWVDSWGDQARLVWDGARYALYLGHTQFWGPQGKHQGDLLRLYGADGTLASGMWEWGCSHSLDLRLVADGATLYPVCLSDCYPEKAILLNHYTKLRDEPTGACNGYSNATLGGLAADPGKGAALTFVSDEGRQGHDVGFVAFDASGTKKASRWLTDTPGVEESSAHLARYGGDFLAAWSVAGQGALQLAVVKADGTLADGPVGVTAAIAPKDDFQTAPGGDVTWAWGEGTQLRIARVRSCR